MELKFEGGESSQEAMNRIVHVVAEVYKSITETAVIVSHGNIISLLLKHYDSAFDFDCWRNLSNPDIYLLNFINNEVALERMWDEDISRTLFLAPTE